MLVNVDGPWMVRGRSCRYPWVASRRMLERGLHTACGARRLRIAVAIFDDATEIEGDETAIESDG